MSSFGEILRQERELRGVSLREIADSTKISVRFLEALEQDRLDVLPGGLFKRAFVRQYANHLGLDAERLVDQFVAAHPEQVRAAAKAPAPPPADRAHPGGALLFVLVGLGAALSVMKLAGPEATQSPDPVVAPPPPSVAPAARDSVYPPPASPRTTPVPEPDVLVLTMNATQACWVEVSVDGQTVMNRVMTQGESQTLEAQGEILLSVGNAGGIVFSVNDRRGLPLGDSGEVRRNIRITKQNLASLLVEPPSYPVSGSS
jgi:cytoskeletal protein RodZ